MPSGVYTRRVHRHAVTQPLNQPYRIIPLTQGQNAIVDTVDFEKLSKFNWLAHWDPNSKSFRAERGSHGRTIRMSHIVLGCRSSTKVDHANHDTLDNRRSNLRKASASQSAANRRGWNKHGYKGISFRTKGASHWQVYVRWKNYDHYVGAFRTKVEAHEAYKKKLAELHRKFACSEMH